MFAFYLVIVADAPFIWSDARVHVNVAGDKTRLRALNRK